MTPQGNPTLYRAYSLLDTKAMNEDEDGKMIIEGIASTPTPDRYLDVVEPKGAKFAVPMPLLWQHMHLMPVGTMDFAKPTNKGIPFKASLPNVIETGRLKDRVDEARQSVKYGLVRAVSIGFQAVRDAVEIMDNGGYWFKEWEWLELSLVTIPANVEATINTVKRYDREARAVFSRKGAMPIVYLDRK